MKVVGKPKLVFSLLISGIFVFWGMLLLTSPYIYMRYVGIFIIAIAIVFTFPALIFPDSIWMVDQLTIQYNSFNSYKKNIIAFYDYYIQKKGIKYQVKINLDMIKYIKVTYTVRPAAFLWGYYYDICFDVRTIDNSKFHFKVLEIGKKRKDFIEAVNLLKKQGIYIIDSYDIISCLENYPQAISFYLEEIEKKQGGKK